MEEVTWNLQFLSKNKLPEDRSGREISALSYSKLSLNDENVCEIAKALKKNNVFSGALDLSCNLISDLGVLKLIRSMKTSSIQKLDLSFNNLNDRSGIYIGDYLGQPNSLKELYLVGCNLEKDGLQRVVENLKHSQLEAAGLGLVSDFGLGVLAEHVSGVDLKYLGLEEGSFWSEEAKSVFLSALKQNYSILEIEVLTENHQEFLEDISSVVARNNNLFREKQNKINLEHSSDPQSYSENLEFQIEASLQNLPVRVYLENALGTALNDSIFELTRFHRKQKDPQKNTAVKNIKWIARYIIDKYVKE